MKRIFILVVFLMFSGCELDLAQTHSKISNFFYQRAIKIYEAKIKDDPDSDTIKFKLGKLYYTHGDFDLAKEFLSKAKLEDATILLAYTYYKQADFTKALALFDSLGEFDDGEYLYFYGLTCEKLNLFDQAINIYAKIKDEFYMPEAKLRISIINSNTQHFFVSDERGEVYELLADADEKKYPQAGAVVFVDEKMQIFSDNTSQIEFYVVAKILNDRGKESMSEIEIGYDSTYEQVELEFARTIKPDSTVVTVGKKNIRDVSRYLNFPLYSNARVRIISMPEVMEGSIIEYKATIKRHKLIDEDKFTVNYSLQESDPIIKAGFSLVVPKDRGINIKTINDKYNIFNAQMEPFVEAIGENNVYRWDFSDIPQILPESNMVPYSWVNPIFLVSNFDSWQQIYDWWWDLAKDKMVADNHIKQKVKELIKDKTHDSEKAEAIAHFCSEKIRYVAVEYGQAGYEPHQAQEIYQNKYGDCKDQVILLITMLKEAGIKAYPVLIGTKKLPELPKDFPILLFNHAIAAVELIDGTYTFIDPTAQTCSFGDLPGGDQDRTVMLFKDKEFILMKTPQFQSDKNSIYKELNIKINHDESIVASRKVISSGFFDQGQRYWLKYTPPQLIEEFLQESIQDISIAAQLEDYKIVNLEKLGKPVELKYNFKGAHYLTKSGPARILPLFSHIDTSLVAKNERRYPLDLSLPYKKEIIFSVEIPQKYKIKYVPENTQFDNEWLYFTNCYEVKGQKLYFSQTKVNKTSIVNTEQYSEFKNSLEALAKKVDQRVILEKR